MTEESIIRNNTNFIRMCALNFIRERGLAPVSYYYEDVFQEACIAYLDWYRKSNNGNPDWKKFAASVIRFHLLRRYVNPFGFAITKYAVYHRRPMPEIKVGVSVMDELVHTSRNDKSDDMEYQIDFDRWLKSLDSPDREIVTLLCKGYKPGEVMEKLGLCRDSYRYCKKRIHKNYDKFFKEVG